MCLNRTDIDFESETHGKKLTDNPWDYIGEFKDGVFDGQGEYRCEEIIHIMVNGRKAIFMESAN